MPLAPADLRVLLVFPPQGHPTQPYLALPSLKAHLAQHGFTTCKVWDLNLDAYDELVSGRRLERALERIRAKADAWGMHERDVLEPRDLERFRLYADALASGGYVAAHVDEAKDVIRDADAFYDRPRYLWAMRTFEAGLKLVSTEYHPALFTSHNYTQSASIDDSASLFAGVDDPDENLFAEFFEEFALPRIEAERPDVLGISVTYGSQMIPALTLATMVKRRWPAMHVTLGGGMLAYVGHRLAHAAPLFDRVDSICVYEGERPLLELCEALATAGGARDGALAPDLSGIANLVYRVDGRTTVNSELLPMPIDELPTPDFDDLPLDRYFSGELVLPIAPARGCYYEKCGFCTLYTAIGPTFRERSVEKLVDDLETLQAKHGTPYFYFIMDDLPPLMARRLPPAIAARGLEVYWWCDARFEERIFNPASLKALYDAGCRKLMYGFESGSQRVLDLVEKGTDLSEAERILRHTHEAGISATLYTMVGLPTETREEADMTRAFIVRNADWIGEISLQIFNLDMVSPMYRDPAKFGIARIVDDPRDLAEGQAPRHDLARYLEHVSVSGMDADEVRQAFNSVLGAANDALAALRGDNFLYYRYKSHIFLYLCRFGVDVFRSEHHPPRPTTHTLRASELPERLRLRDDVTVARLPFPYGQVRDRLDRAWSDPTPLGGPARSIGGGRTGSTPVTARPSAVAFVGREHRYFELGDGAARLLHGAEREGTLRALDALPAERRAQAADVLLRAYDTGLLVGADAPAREDAAG
ncbi:MAG: radical SAM protein [Planctomycetes bacterium]|nr:radical SAM protein [Planctomycetota bacterium]